MDIGVRFNVKVKSLGARGNQVLLKGKMKDLVKAYLLFIAVATWIIAPFMIGTLLPWDDFVRWSPRIVGGGLLIILLVGKVQGFKRSGLLIIDKSLGQLQRKKGLRHLPAVLDLPEQGFLVLDSYTHYVRRASVGVSESVGHYVRMYRLLIFPLETIDGEERGSIEDAVLENNASINTKAWGQGETPPLPDGARQLVVDENYSFLRAILEATATTFDWSIHDLVSQGTSINQISLPQQVLSESINPDDASEPPEDLATKETPQECEILFLQGGIDKAGLILFGIVFGIISLVRFWQEGNYIPAIAYGGLLTVLWIGIVSQSVVLTPQGIREKIRFLGSIPMGSKVFLWDQIGDINIQMRTTPWLVVMGNSGEGALLEISIAGLGNESKQWLLNRIRSYVFEQFRLDGQQ